MVTAVSLYSALDKVETITLLYDLNEMGKAFEQYYMDTKQMLPNNSSDPANIGFYQLRSGALIDGKDKYGNSIKGFRGPYMDYEKGVSNMLYQGSISVYMYPLLMTPSSTQLGNTKSWQSALCTAGKACGLWIRLDPITSDDILKKLDKMIDDGDGLTAGKVRWQVSSSTRYHLFYNYMPIPNPHN